MVLKILDGFMTTRTADSQLEKLLCTD